MIKHRFPYCTLFILILSATSVIACSSNRDGAAKTVETYITALSEQDANLISSLSCSEWEQTALVELDSFTAVSSKVENLSCTESSQEGDDVFVSCTGKIALDYGGEVQEIDLSSRLYIVRQESGEWRMCGYR